MFHSLGETEIAVIVRLQLELLRKRMAERDIGLELSDEAIAWIARTGFDPDYGARPLKRVIQKQVADPIAIGLLAGDYQPGDTVEISAEHGGGLVFAAVVANV